MGNLQQLRRSWHISQFACIFRTNKNRLLDKIIDLLDHCLGVLLLPPRAGWCLPACSVSYLVSSAGSWSHLTLWLGLGPGLLLSVVLSIQLCPNFPRISSLRYSIALPWPPCRESPWSPPGHPDTHLVSCVKCFCSPLTLFPKCFKLLAWASTLSCIWSHLAGSWWLPPVVFHTPPLTCLSRRPLISMMVFTGSSSPASTTLLPIFAVPYPGTLFLEYDSMSSRNLPLNWREVQLHWSVIHALSLSPLSFFGIWKRPCCCCPAYEGWSITDPPQLGYVTLWHPPIYLRGCVLFKEEQGPCSN